MDYFRQNFGDRMLVAAIVLLVTAIAAAVAARRPGPFSRLERAAQVSRVCSVGFVAAAVVATTNGIGSGQGFIWGIGNGGLNAADLARFPHTIQSVLLVGNVLLFIPFGLSAALGWPQHSARSLLVALAVPIVIEFLQLVVLQGVASADDIILNATGVLTGWLLGRAVVALLSRTP